MKSSRNPGVEKLKSDPAYRLVHELDFQEMIPFVLTHIRKKGIISLTYIGVNLAMLGFIAFSIVLGILDQSFTWRTAIGQVLMGILCGSILVIPFHELLHGAAYRLLGAKSIKFGADLQQFIFFVTADRYPVSGRQLYFLALTPFVVINAAVFVITLLFMQHTLLLSGFLLLSHNIMCIGDFAIINYVHGTKGKLYSFDEPGEKKSYFFEEVEQGE